MTDWRQKAIALSSHNGHAEHVEAASSLLSPAEWGLLQTAPDFPLVPFGAPVAGPNRWQHNSSGHHAAILRGCRLKGWNRAGYMLPAHPVFRAYLEVMRRYLGADYAPKRIARDGDGLPTLAMCVTELARAYAGLAARAGEDWIWDAFVREPDLIGGFNRLDSTILKSCAGRVIAKEGADGLLAMAVQHPDFPAGLGIAIKIAHGWNAQATWYVARAVLGVLGFELRNPYPLRRQKAFVAPGVVPPDRQATLAQIPSWDAWDADIDRWNFDPAGHQDLWE